MTQKKLGSIIKISKGRKQKLSEEINNDAVRVLSINDLRNDKIIQYTNDVKGVEVNTDDIMIAWDGANAGTIGFGKKGVIGSTIARLRITEKEYYSFLFLGYYLKSKFKYLQKHTTGATIPHINKNSLESIVLPEINYNDQIHIANILSRAEKLIAKRKESIKLLDELLKSTFLELFGNPVSNEKGWERKTLSIVCSKITDGTHYSPPIVENGIPYITAKHIKENKIIFEDKPWYISLENHKKIYNRCNPKYGDVLYIKDGATTGKAAINRYDFEFSMLSSVALLKPQKDYCLSEYLTFWLNNVYVKKSIISNVAGGAIKRLTLRKINKILILIPPIKLQTQFAEIVKKVEKTKAKNEISLKELENLFASLSQRAFKGELNLNEFELIEQISNK